MSTQMLNQISQAAFEDEMQKLAKTFRFDATGGIANEVLKSFKSLPYSAAQGALTGKAAVDTILSANALRQLKKKNFLKRMFLTPGASLQHQINKERLGMGLVEGMHDASRAMPAGVAGLGAIGLMSALKKKKD